MFFSVCAGLSGGWDLTVANAAYRSMIALGVMPGLLIFLFVLSVLVGSGARLGLVCVVHEHMCGPPTCDDCAVLCFLSMGMT